MLLLPSWVSDGDDSAAGTVALRPNILLLAWLSTHAFDVVPPKSITVYVITFHVRMMAAMLNVSGDPFTLCIIRADRGHLHIYLLEVSLVQAVMMINGIRAFHQVVLPVVPLRLCSLDDDAPV